MTSDEKTCPFCAEIIKRSAIKCKFCDSKIDGELTIPIETTPKITSDSKNFWIRPNASPEGESSRSNSCDLNKPILTSEVKTVTTGQQSISQNNLTSKSSAQLVTKRIWLGLATTLVIAITAWFYWKSESILQKFINLDPQFKQVSLYEDSLKIKSIKIDNIKNGKELIYDIKGCEFSVQTDDNNNVSSYELNISNSCPSFNIELGGLMFDSKKSTLKNIINQINDKNSNCYRNYLFRVEYVIFLGNAYDPSDLNYLELNGSRACNSKQIIFTFPEDKGIEQWKEKIKNDYGGFDNLPDDQREKINSDGKYNKLAENLWSDQKPSKIMIK
jgi:hypothetical protein